MTLARHRGQWSVDLADSRLCIASCHDEWNMKMRLIRVHVWSYILDTSLTYARESQSHSSSSVYTFRRIWQRTQGIAQ